MCDIQPPPQAMAVLLLLLSPLPSLATDYCGITPRHTMCQYQVGNSCSCYYSCYYSYYYS